MRLVCTVKQVEESRFDNEYLIVTTLGQCVTENQDVWPAKQQSFTIRNTPKARRAYYIGRKLEMDITPK